MKSTILRLICLALPMFFPSAQEAQEATNSSCSADFVTHLTAAQLKESLDCIDMLAKSWNHMEIASVLDSLNTMTRVLKKQHEKVCAEATPKNCSNPIPPSKGGLVCATVGKARYCKPMCNEGHDFGWLRRSRLFEECKEEKGKKSSWSTQYVGGNRLAVCNRANIQIAGAKTAYFPEGQDCLKTMSQSDLERDVTETFVSELRNSGIKGEADYVCLICG